MVHIAQSLVIRPQCPISRHAISCSPTAKLFDLTCLTDDFRTVEVGSEVDQRGHIALHALTRGIWEHAPQDNCEAS